MKKRILIADDEPNIVISLEFVMRQNGFETRTAANGDEALKAVEEFDPDLLLLDVMMPVRNGYEICQTLRDNPALKKVKIVMLTAKGRELEVAKGLAMGADAYITKPFATQELLDTVKRLLGP